MQNEIVQLKKRDLCLNKIETDIAKTMLWS